jgi:hypothetical protein
MATITTIEVYPSIGACWQAAINYWATWVQDNTITITTGVGTTLSCRTIIMNDTHGGNTYQHILVALDIPGTNVLVPVPHIMQSPGWRTMPPILNSVYGTTTTVTNWSNTMLGLRAVIWGTLCGITNPTWTTTDYAADITGLRQRHSVTTVKKQAHVAVDAVLCGVVDGTLAAGTTITQLPTDGMGQHVPVATEFSLAPAQFDALRNAILDVALVDIEYSFNNGADLFSMRSAFRVE